MCESYLIQKIASDAVIDQAYNWLCELREDYSHNNDVWRLRLLWRITKPDLQNRLLAGIYQFGALTEIRLPDDTIELWRAQDALVLKAMAIVLGHVMNPVLSDRCFHIAGRGGAKAAVRETLENLKPGSHIMKSDVKGYYANIDHNILYGLAEEFTDDPAVLQLIWQYMNRTVCYGGLYREVTRGISPGCPLSPLMGALYLKPLDDRMREQDVFYARFMDDWVIIAPTRWKLRRTVRIVNETLNLLKVEKHPDKTFIGRAERGFDFLGYFMKPGGLGPSAGSLKRFAERIARLYEQNACLKRIGQYILRWFRWVSAGVRDFLNFSSYNGAQPP